MERIHRRHEELQPKMLAHAATTTSPGHHFPWNT